MSNSFRKGWTFKKIEDVADIVGGGTPSTKRSEYFGGNIPWIRPKDLSNHQVVYISKGEKNITEIGLKNSSAKLLPKGTILLSTRAPIGYLAIAKNPVTTNQGFRSLVVKSNKVNNLFLYYLLKINIDKLKQNASGATFGELSGSTLKSIIFLFPPIDTQKKIAAILSAYDDLIENNTRRIKILEEMSRTIYNEWFVKFRFPGHEKVKMVNSELGKIPEGWKVLKLGDILSEIESGKRPKGGVGEISNGIPSIGAENILGLGQYDYSKEKYVPLEFFNTMNKGIIKHKDILLYKDGAKIGRKSMFRDGFPHKHCCINEHVFILRTKEIHMQNYLHFWLDQDWMTERIKNLNTNAAQPGINQNGVKSLPFLKPNIETVERFDDIVEHLLKQIFSLAKKQRILQLTRDILLPKLINGEIDL